MAKLDWNVETLENGGVKVQGVIKGNPLKDYFKFESRELAYQHFSGLNTFIGGYAPLLEKLRDK